MEVRELSERMRQREDELFLLLTLIIGALVTGYFLTLSHEHHFPHVHSDQTLDVALHRMGNTGMRVLPVVSRSDIRRLEGIVTLDDVLRVYGLEEEGE
jgi:Mg/Co/Ni transporter MgtE